MARSFVQCSRPDLWVVVGDTDWLLVNRADRLVNWANAGAWDGGAKGIPDTSGWVVINVVTGYGAYNDGTHMAETTAAIQAAINAAAPYTVIYFPPGTYLFSALTGKSRIVLQGAGPTLTTLLCLGSGSAPAIAFDGLDGLTGPYTISSGATKGSSSVVVSSVAGLATGDVVTVFPDIPDHFLTDYGGVQAGIERLPIESTYPPQGETYEGWSYNGATYPRTGVGSNCQWYEGFGQLVEITSIFGNVVYFKEPLYYDYSAHSPRLKKRGPFLETSGVESMKVQFQVGAANGGHLIRFWYAKNCWVRKCEIYNTHLHGLYFRHSKSCEVTGNYLHHGTYYIGDTCYLVSMADYNSDHLVYDNIVRHGRHHIVFEGGGQGCVIGYNYSLDTCGDVVGWMFSDMGLHGRHPYMNLWEGNYGGGLDFDSIHGSSSHNVVLRNAFSARGVNDFAPGGYTAAQIALKVAKDSVYHTFVGNVLGYPGCAVDGYEFEHYEAGFYRKYMQYIGASGDTAGPISANPEFEFPWSMPRTTGIFHGNYDYADGNAKWDPAISGHGIPNSLYLASKPAWFGSLDWPAVGPDVAGQKKDIPAKVRWDRYVVTGNKQDLFRTGFVIDHNVVQGTIDSSLDRIPVYWIAKAKTDLKIAYGTASHGTQLIYGMNCLKTWDGTGLYDWNNGGSGGALDIRWWGAPTGFGNLGISFSIDLLAPDGTYDPTRAVWVSSTRTYLNAHPEVNVCMWAWCYGMATSESDINLYLSQMEMLEAEYPGVKFVYMTGHSDGSGLAGLTHLRAQQIKDYCRAHGKFLYDFYDIECYDPSGAYFGDHNVSADCSYVTGNWATEWQATHTNGVDWFTCANCVDVHSPDLNCNSKAVAAWHLWARLAGWDGT